MKKNLIFISISTLVLIILSLLIFRWKHFLNEPTFMTSYTRKDINKRNVELEFMSQDINSNKYYFTSLNKTQIYRMLNLTIEDISNEQSTSTDFYIDTTQKYILKVNESNVIKTIIPWKKKWGEVIDIVANQNGEIFVHWIRRDKFGTEVLEEGIRKYSGSGYKKESIFEEKFVDNTDHLFFSDPRIKHVHIDDDKVYFYYTKFEAIDLYVYDTELKKIFEIPKGEQYYYTHIIGNSPGNIYFATDKSEFGKITQNKEINILKNFLTEKMVLRDIDFSANGRSVNINVEFGDEDRLYIYDNAPLDMGIWNKPTNDSSTDKFDLENNPLKYGGVLLAKKYATYLMVICFFALLVYLIRYIAIYVFQNKIYIIFKQLFILVPVILVIMIFSVFNIMVTGLEEFVDQLNEGKFYTFNKIIDNKINDISQRVGKAYYLADMLEEMNMYELPQDDRITRLYGSIDLTHVVINGENVNGVYTIIDKVVGENAYKITDTKEKCTVFEKNKDIGSKELNTIISRKQNVYKIYKNGNNISAMKPIKNRAGEVVGIYQLGMNYNSYRQDLDLRYFFKVNIGIIITTLLLILVIVLVTYVFLRPLIRLTKKVNEVTKGNLDVKFDIKSRDEVEALNDAFHKMRNKLKKDIDHIMTLNDIYHRFVPEELIQLIDRKEIENIMLGEYTELNICILNIGIKDFYKISEKLTQEESFRFINRYFKLIGPIIREHGGIIERYYDTGAIGILPQRSDKAIEAALKIIRETKKISGYLSDGDESNINIAIHKGVTLLGIIGEDRRLQSSIVSDSLNLAEIIKQRTEELSAQIVVTEEVMSDIKDPEFKCRSLGKIKISQRSETIKLYDIYEEDNRKFKKLKDETKDVFEESIRLFQNEQFYDSRAKFGRILDRNIIDNVAREYFYQSDKFYREGKDEKWDGSLRIN